MVKIGIRVYLEHSDYKRLLNTIKSSNYSGRGALSLFLQDISKGDLILVPKNIKEIFKLFS